MRTISRFGGKTNYKYQLMMNKQINFIMKKLVKSVENVIFLMLALFVSFVILQIFFFSTFKIPSDSMSPALEAGDNVLVCKAIIGPRLFNIFVSLRNEQTKIYRLPGLKKIQRNDVLVFNFPCPNNWETIEMHILKYYVKRCIGLPGDSLSIKNGLFHIEGYQGILGNRLSQIKIQDREEKDFEGGVFHCFPYDSTLCWNIKDFGALYIPKAGTSILLDRQNFLLYKKLIEWEQQEHLYYRDTSVYLKNKKIDTYQFQKNYYFMAGDNGENSQDSRYWGLLPEEYIVGKAWIVWKSIDPYTGKIRWKRLFNLVN
jgi:signal peptidase I